MKINYAIGHYWDDSDGAVGCYMTYSNDVHFGTLKEAEDHLEYVKSRSPEKNWRIFQLVEVPRVEKSMKSRVKKA